VRLAAHHGAMLTESTITTMLPVTDSERAGHFYTDSLGLKQTGKSEDGTQYFAAGAGAIGLRPMPAGAQSENTALSFEVTDLRSEVSALEDRGVRFQDFELEGLKTVDHIAEMGTERAAWFTDSEGNVLCLHEVLG
jgi:predicted enzyme related to lactoylglutathione lyase